MNLVSLLIIALSAYSITFVTGFLVLRAVTALSITECWSFSGVAGSTLLSGLTFSAFLLQQFHREFYIEFLLVILFICLIGIRIRHGAIDALIPPLWVKYSFLFWMLLVAFQCIPSVYTGAFTYGDWWMHFDISQFYLGLQPANSLYFDSYTIPSRTPLFNLFSGFFLATFANHFAVYQMVALLPGLALIGVLRMFIDPRYMLIALGLICFNPFLISMMLYPWPKMIAAAYVLSSIYYYSRWQSEAQAQCKLCCLLAWGFWLGLAILAHSATCVYGVGMVLDTLLRRPSRSNLRHILLVGVVVGCVISPWILWVSYSYGFAALWTAAPTFVVAQNHIGSFAWWLDRTLNMLGTLVPIPLLVLILQGTENGWLWWNGWLRFFYAVLPGACTLTISFILGRQLIQQLHIRPISAWQPLGIIAITGFVGSIMLQPGLNLGGLIGENMITIIIILLIIAVYRMKTLPLREQQLFMILISLEFFASRGIQTFLEALALLPIDQNMLLKQTYHIPFARDIVGSAWVGCTIVILVGYSFFLWQCLGFFLQASEEVA